MTTVTTMEPNTGVPNLLHEEESSGVPPLSIERALKSCHGAPSLDTIITDEEYVSMLEMKSMVVPSLESHYTEQEALQTLQDGGCLFTFQCRHELDSHQAEMVNSVVNLSAFENETTDNYVPHYEYPSDNEEDEYTFLLARAAYVLVGVDIQALLSNPSLLSTFAYQQSCQPAATTIWNDYHKMEPNNFRITKPIIPYIYNFTIQFRVSAILDEHVLERLGRHVGTRVDGGILLERTKRSHPPKEDATVKCKSVLLYTILQEGVVLVTHLTVILQQGLPEILERAIDTFGEWGLTETCETAWRTRRYLQTMLPVNMSMPEEEEDANFFDAVDDNDEDNEGSSSTTESDEFLEAALQEAE